MRGIISSSIRFRHSPRARFWPLAGGVLIGTVPGTVLTAQCGSALSQGKTSLTAV